MSIIDLYLSTEHSNNLAHFSAIINLALTDGVINPEEKSKINSFARKLDVSETEYEEIIKNPSKYPLITPISLEQRAERLYDFFRIVYADHHIDNEELSLLKRYAIGLGYKSDQADVIIKKSIKIFSGDIDFEDYQYLMKQH